MSENSNGWETFYYAAVAELDPVQLLLRIEAAQKAIGDRLADAVNGRNPIDAKEQHAIEDARHSLFFLKKHPAARPMPPTPQIPPDSQCLMCSFCRMPVKIEVAKTDEDGMAIHEDCCVLKMILTQAKPKKGAA